MAQVVQQETKNIPGSTRSLREKKGQTISVLTYSSTPDTVMPPSLLGRVSQEDDITSPELKSQPPGGVVADVLISLIAVTLLAFFIMVLGIFVHSWLFVFTTGIIKYGVDLNSSYNFYLTTLFLMPLRCLYSLKDIPQTPSNIRLRSMVMRTFVGAILTTLSSSTNIAFFVGLNGEPGWLCLLCCNCDILFCSIVVQWVTSHDNSATTNSTELKIAVLTAARESYRDRSSGGTLRGSASGDNASSHRDADSVSRGGEGGGIHRCVTTTTEYTPLGEMDVTTYPFRRADNNAAHWSTEILNCDPQQQQQPEHTPAEMIPLQYEGEATTTTTRPTTATTDPDRARPGVVVGAGVVETVIVGGKDTAAAEPFGKGSASNS
ncbi:hypothetical protein LQW54_012558 [Pestalotiopsis sp. IQ-011]